MSIERGGLLSRLGGRTLTAILAAGALIGGPLAGALPAQAADAPVPTVTVTPDRDLDPEGPNALTVTGEGFKPFAPPTHFGIYVAVGPAGLFDTDNFHTNSALFAAPQYVSGVSSDGSFSQELELNSPIIDSDGKTIDCTQTECGVYTWAAHGSEDRTQDTYTPITFAEVEEETPAPGEGVEPPAPGDNEESPGSGDEDEQEAPVPGDDGETPGIGDESEQDLPTPTVTVSPSTGLNPKGTNTLTVTGEGFKPFAPPTHFGIYVAVGPAGLFDTDNFHTNSALFAAPQYVSGVSSDGSFSQELELNSPIIDSDGKTIDCTQTECGVYTWAAHGSKDRTQDTYTPITFAKVGGKPGTGAGTTNPGTGAGKPGTGDKGGKPGKCVAGASSDFTWAIHDGFLNYITGPIAKGSISTKGVTRSGSQFNFKYKSGNYNPAKKSGIVKFTGAVSFSGHGGGLDVTLANPQLHINGTTGLIVLDVTTSGKLKKNVQFAAVDLKAAKVTSSSFTATGAGTVLTNAGSSAMQGFYDSGSKAAPIKFSFKFGAATECGEAPQKVVTPKPKTAGKGQGSAGPSINLASDSKEVTENVPMCRSAEGASLNWGIKQSFTDYVTGPIAAGSISTANGVGGKFTWPGRASTYDPETGTGQISFGGTVTFSGHGGALNMRISNPRVQIVDGSQARLFADVRSTNPAGKVTVDSSGVHIANLNVAGKKSEAGDKVTFTGVPATLTAAGVPAFAEFYEAGSSLDALSVTITLGAEVPCSDVGAGSGSLPRTGNDLDLAAAGAVFLLLGLAAVAARRRVRVTA